MSSFENEIRRVMLEHDRQAPGEADLLRALEQAAETRRPGPSHRVRWYVPLLAAAAIAAVIAASLWVGGMLAGHRRAPVVQQSPPVTSPLSCPARYARPAPWVPAMPSGFNGRSRLVPERTPRSALICAYDGRNIGPQSAWALSGQRTRIAGLARLAAELSWQPRKLPAQQIPCTLMGGNQTNYLIGLTYSGGGTIWVAATVDPNYCVNTANGEFKSFAGVGPLVQRAFRTGRWPRRPVASCQGRNLGEGRLGQETAMVPPGSTTLIICDAHLSRVIRSGYGRLVTALNSLPTFLSTRGCAQRGPSRVHYRLLFSYQKGPPVVVDVIKGCYPEIDNLSLQSSSANSILPIISRLVHPG